MFEDLAKIAAFGYVGSKMSQEMSKRMDERKKEQAETLQQLKNFAFVVYDGKAPYTAAQNLVKYLTDEGYESAAVDPELYYSRLERPPIMEHSRIIIIGHHDFTKEQMTTVGSEGWQHICIAATSTRWDESINFIATLKPAASAPAEQEVLFILKQYTGDSFGVAHWYKLSSDGDVTEYEEHPYDPESFEKSWNNQNE